MDHCPIHPVCPAVAGTVSIPSLEGKNNRYKKTFIDTYYTLVGIFIGQIFEIS